MSDFELLVTPQMRSDAKDNKACGTVTMNPYDFLRLTLNTANVMQWIEEEKPETKSLKQYNEWVRSGNIRVMPFLDVDRYSGKVLGHEGRHRAAAFMNEGHRGPMEVAICLREEGYKVYYENPYKDDRRYYLVKRYMGPQDVPDILTGQFRSGVSVKLSMRTFKPFYSDKETEMPKIETAKTKKFKTKATARLLEVGALKSAPGDLVRSLAMRVFGPNATFDPSAGYRIKAGTIELHVVAPKPYTLQQLKYFSTAVMTNSDKYRAEVVSPDTGHSPNAIRVNFDLKGAA